MLDFTTDSEPNKRQMKMKNSRNAVVGYWQNLIVQGDIITIARKYREKIGMPLSGFDSTEVYEKWKIDTEKKHGTDSFRIEVFNEFQREIKNTVKYAGVLSDLGFRRLLISYFWYNTLEDSDLEELKFSEFLIVNLLDGKPFLLPEVLEDGVYIKIGAKSSINLVKDFVAHNSKLIKSAQEFYLGNVNVSHATKFKPHNNFKRDNLITALCQYSTKDLRKIGAVGRTKEALIADLMKKLGYNKGIMNSGIVKSVIQRRRRMIKAIASK